MRKIGLFCGTFNPIHSGHLLIAECARDQFNLDRVFFITSPSPPHRQDQSLLDASARHDMVSVAVADNPYFEASSVELERDGLSYTIDTVEHFQKLYPKTKISLVIGGDNVKYLKDWHRSPDLFKQCHFLVAPRLISFARQESSSEVSMKTLVKKETVELKGMRISVIDFPGIAISASYIRGRLARRQTVLYMVPPAVNKILTDNKYYLDPK
ncbi:MAG: nicotinate-nucleotide adenylyltransferase [Candidatus Obscuribacterales bacterium]